MKKLLPFLLFVIVQTKLFGQDYNETRTRDSLRIDSMKKGLSALKGTERIDALIALSVATDYMTPNGGFAAKDDTVKNYTVQALKEATASGYRKGIAMALLVS